MKVQSWFRWVFELISPTSMVVKGLNLRGVTEFCRAWLRRPELLVPHLSVKDLNDIPFQTLRDRGFKGVVFDKDNTLTVPHHHEIAPHLQESFDECKRVFGDRVVIFSNSAGSNDDAGFRKATQIESELQCAVLRHNQKKPDGIEHVKAFFGAEAEELIMIGDRYSTDVLFGNLHAIKLPYARLLTIRTDQFTHDGESIINVQMQNIESTLIARLLRAGIVAPDHPLLVDKAPLHAADSAKSP